MVMVMWKAPGVGLAAPQIGVPLKIIVLEDTKEYISYAPKEETKAQDRCPFDLLEFVNPSLLFTLSMTYARCLFWHIVKIGYCVVDNIFKGWVYP
ncbi:hypothetical protein ACSBR2_042742 [Camellia fascicularis]